ncbi:MAG: hypothetical protein RIB45_08820 [Marivibrio sp.]|uniref:hypothetical protein n=1 Tax=Marivibrio sp. TaxID=2039719 RepID=UPI0032ED48B4
MKRFLSPAVWIIAWLAIDEEPLAILDALNDCVDAYDGTRVGDYEARLDALIARLRVRFAHEEETMAAHGYPGLLWRRDRHAGSLAALEDIRTACARKGYADREDVVSHFDEVPADAAKADLRFQSHLQDQGRLTQADIDRVRSLFAETRGSR